MYLSPQAIVLIICNAIILMLMLINVFIPRKDSQKLGNKGLMFLVIILFIIPIMLIQIYSLNCMVTGSCTKWSWTLSIIAVIFTVVYVIGFVTAIIRLKRNAGPSTQTIE